MSTDYTFKKDVTVADFLQKLPDDIVYNPTSHYHGCSERFRNFTPHYIEKFCINKSAVSWLWIYAARGIIGCISRSSPINDGAEMIQPICDALGVEIESDDGEVFKPRTSDPESPPVGTETPG